MVVATCSGVRCLVGGLSCMVVVFWVYGRGDSDGCGDMSCCGVVWCGVVWCGGVTKLTSNLSLLIRSFILRDRYKLL